LFHYFTIFFSRIFIDLSIYESLSINLEFDIFFSEEFCFISKPNLITFRFFTSKKYIFLTVSFKYNSFLYLKSTEYFKIFRSYFSRNLRFFIRRSFSIVTWFYLLIAISFWFSVKFVNFYFGACSSSFCLSLFTSLWLIQVSLVSISAHYFNFKAFLN